jgi:hypothetical protein
MRERILKLLLLLIGVAILAGNYPLFSALLDPHTTISAGDQMILGIYQPIGIFLLFAVRNPAAHRSLILAFGWSMITHGAVMTIQSTHAASLRDDLPGLAAFTLIGVAVLLLAPRKTLPAAATVPASAPRLTPPTSA